MPDHLLHINKIGPESGARVTAVWHGACGWTRSGAALRRPGQPAHGAVSIRPTTAAVVVVAGIVFGRAVGLGWLFRSRWGLVAPRRKVRRRITGETRPAAAVEPLESTGWVAQHDRLVAHERVPHILLSPPGALVQHPHSFDRDAPTLARVHRVGRLGRHPAPQTVQPEELGHPTALRTHDNLVTVMAANAWRRSAAVGVTPSGSG